MNSFNHYAYGAVADWVYETAAGIHVMEEYPGFERVMISPSPDRRLGWLEASIDTRHGKVLSKWTQEEAGVKYEIETEVPAQIVIGDQKWDVEPGRYTLWGGCV